MKKFLTNNLGLKILSLIFSIGLWLAVVNISDPEITRSFSGIPVDIQNTDLVTKEGKVFSVLDNTDTVSVEVRGKRSIIDIISKDDIQAVADMNDLTFMNTVTIKVNSTKYTNQLRVQCMTENLKLDIENIKRVQLPIEIDAVGEPSEGYLVGTMTPDQNIVRISGPESLIDTIDHIGAEVSVDGWKTDINTSADLKLYDAEGNQIKNSGLTQNITSVLVDVTILKTKTVPLSYTTSGTPANGYLFTGDITSNPDAIEVAGKKSVIDNLETINIAETELNITGQTEDMTAFIDISKYLPSGVQFADSSFNGKASVTVGIEASETRDFDVPMKNISISNSPEEFDTWIEGAEDDDAVFTITLTGLASKIIQMKDENIYGKIDMEKVLKEKNEAEWKEGIYNAAISFALPEDVTADGTYTVHVHVDKQKTEN